jgi:hypothetical protein
MRGFRPVRLITRSTAGLSRGASGGLPGCTSWSSTIPSWCPGLGFVPELDRLAQPALPDRAGVRVVQTDRRVTPSGVVPASRCRVCSTIRRAATGQLGGSAVSRSDHERVARRRGSGPAAWCEPRHQQPGFAARRHDPVHGLRQQPGVGRMGHIRCTTVVSTRTLEQRKTFASAAFANNASTAPRLE